jgi:hypothetical protein
MTDRWWIAFVVGAVLSWGVYVPTLHEGQSMIGGGRPSEGALRAFLCVGFAYFVTAVLIPVGLLLLNLAGGETLDFRREGVFNFRGVSFATAAGTAGAAGALCIILSIKNGGKPLYIAPLVFAGAPIVNAIVSLIWHPPAELTNPKMLPGWGMFAAGLVLAALGAGLVLYSKGYIDQQSRSLQAAKAKAGLVAAAAAPTGESAIRAEGTQP